MRRPDGGTGDIPGSCLEILPPARLVFNSLLLSDWRPTTPWPPFTAITMADDGDGTRDVANPEGATGDRRAELGFFDGWGTCIDQLEALAQALR